MLPQKRNSFTNEIFSRQDRYLEKTSQIKAQAILWQAKEKNKLREFQKPKTKTSATPKSSSTKHLEILRAVSASHRFDLQSSPIAEKEETEPVFDVIPEKALQIKDTKENAEKPSNHIQRKHEKSLSLSESKADVLDSLVRFDGESCDVDKLNVVKVNPSIDLRLLFSDELKTGWDDN